MKEEKVYELLSRLVDDELPPHQKLKVLNEMKKNAWWQEEYHKLKQLKMSLSSPPPLTLSPYFETSLRAKIIEQQNQQSWFEKLIDAGMLGKLSYSLVAASVIFIGFLMANNYLPLTENLGSTTEMLASTTIRQRPKIQRERHIALPTPVSSHGSAYSDMAILGTRGILTIVKGNQTIKINLHTGKPYNDMDNKKIKYFQGVLTNLKYMQGLYFKERGNYQKSQECFKAFVKKYPNTELAKVIIAKELNGQ